MRCSCWLLGFLRTSCAGSLDIPSLRWGCFPLQSILWESSAGGGVCENGGGHFPSRKSRSEQCFWKCGSPGPHMHITEPPARLILGKHADLSLPVRPIVSVWDTEQAMRIAMIKKHPRGFLCIIVFEKYRSGVLLPLARADGQRENDRSVKGRKFHCQGRGAGDLSATEGSFLPLYRRTDL